MSMPPPPPPPPPHGPPQGPAQGPPQGPGQGGYPAVQYGYQKPPKRRPSGWWFLPGAIALAIALACGVFGGLTIAGTFHTDGYVLPGATGQAIELDKTGEHMLFTTSDASAPLCVVTEGGPPLDLKVETETNTVDNGTGSWVPFASFTTESTRIEVTCEDAQGSIRVGAPAGRDQFIRIGLSFIGAAVMGLLGLAGTIVVAVLFFSRPSRKVTG
jgi:hypothetical protein